MPGGRPHGDLFQVRQTFADRIEMFVGEIVDVVEDQKLYKKLEFT